MSRYLILFLLSLPLAIAACINIAKTYKLELISRRQLIFRLLMWLLIISGIASTKFLYDFLFSNKLTQSNPMSLFDVVEITGVIYLFALVGRMYTKNNVLEQQILELHRQVAIHFSEKDKKPKKSIASKP